ncbi:CHRD domain-containing protein [Candidatus Uhrbacteria bacterium]|nr:CHRD domain-containing protein [Candidatus Uhrbacteria bacterium]
MRSALLTPSARGPTGWISLLVGTLLVLSGTLPALAQETPYTDVPAGAYYEEAASALLELHALDANETRLRPSDLATRAEMMKLLVNLRGEPLVYPVTSGFDDVARNTWYFPYVEAAARAGWVHGDRNCYQASSPCTARPADPVNRAEAAALLNRVFGMQRTGAAPVFSDNRSGNWYYDFIQIAADHCVLQGDAGTDRVRPAAFMNRAEMVVMFYRASQNMSYGVDCGVPRTMGIEQVTPTSSTLLTVTFLNNLNVDRAEDPARYTLARLSDGAAIGISSAVLVNAHTVRLQLSGNLQSGTTYILGANNLLSSDGAIFSDTGRFTFAAQAGNINSVNALSSTRIRVTFDTDIDRGRAEDAARWTVARASGGGSVDVQSATAVSARIVDLQLRNSLAVNVAYNVSADNMMTTAGVFFSDTASVVLSAPNVGHITDVQAVTSTVLRVTFDADLDEVRAEQTIRYSVSSDGHILPLRTARLLSDRHTVELSLTEAMTSQRSYAVNVHDMLTVDGTLISDSGAAIYQAGNVSFTSNLTGDQEVPTVVTTARGTGSFVLTADGLQYDVTVINLSGSLITGAHFHMAAIGTNGPVVMPITFSGNRAVGTWTDIPLDQRNALLNGNIYVNVHTAAHPDGEIRGQLRIVP